MKILNLNLNAKELINEVRSTYLISNFLGNCETFKIEVIDGIDELKTLIKKFKKFDKLSVAQQVNLLINQ